MNGNLIDTNVIIKLLNSDTKTIDIFDSLDDIYISVITVGELYYGANKSTRAKENIKIFHDFLSEYPIIPIDEEVSLVYGKTKSEVAAKGINIPENDLWIASVALKNDLNLVTFDRHFEHINRLNIIS